MEDDYSFLKGFPKKPRTGITPRLRLAPAPAPVAEMGYEMGSRATLPSTVNLRVPAEHRSVPAQEGRDPAVPEQGLQPQQRVRAPFQEEGISIKDQDPNRPSQAEDPSKPSAKGKEKLDLGKTPRGEQILSLHEQALDKGKNVTHGECSKPAASPASPGELPGDHPMKQEADSLLHTAFLVVSAHGKMLIEQLVDYLEMESQKKKFPDNWSDELENQLMSNRHFREREGMITVCGDRGQPPSKRIVNKEMEPAVAIGGQDKNILAERSHAGKSTESEVQERPPPLPLAVRTPRLPKPSDEDSDWIPSMEALERAAAPRGRRGPYQKRQIATASESEEKSSSAMLPELAPKPAVKECAETDGVWGCTSKALQGELHCERHKRRSSAPKECAMMDGNWRCTLKALQDELFCAEHSEKKMQKMTQKLQK